MALDFEPRSKRVNLCIHNHGFWNKWVVGTIVGFGANSLFWNEYQFPTVADANAAFDLLPADQSKLRQGRRIAGETY